MWYAFASATQSLVTRSWDKVLELKKLCPYPKIKAFQNEYTANQWLINNDYATPIKFLRNYGRTLKGFTIHAQYKIIGETLFVLYNTKDVGLLYIKETLDNSTVVERSGYKTLMRVDGLHLDNSSYHSHALALYTLLGMLNGNYDINVRIHYYSIFYALTIDSQNGSGDTGSLFERVRTARTGVAWSYGENEIEI